MMRPHATARQQRSSRGSGTERRPPASSLASSTHQDVAQPSPIYASPAAAAEGAPANDGHFEAAAAAADVDFERTIDADELQTIIDEAALQGGRFAQAPEDLRNVVLVLAGHNQAMREQQALIQREQEAEAALRRKQRREEESMREPITPPSASRSTTLQRGQSTAGFYARHPSLGARTGVSSVGCGATATIRRTDSRATADTWRSRGTMQSNVFVPAESLARSGTHTAFSPSARAVPTVARGKAREPPKHSLQWVKVHRRERVNEAWAVLRSLETSAAVLKDSLEPLWCYPPGDIDRNDAPDTDLDLQGQIGLLAEVRGYIATAKDAMLEFMGEGFTQSEKRTIGGNVHKMQSRRQKATTFQYIPSGTLGRPENLDERYNMKHEIEPASFYDPVAHREVDSEGFPVEEEEEDDEEFTVDDDAGTRTDDGHPSDTGPHKQQQQESIAVSPATEATASADPVPAMATSADDNEEDGTCVRELEFDTTAHTAASEPSPAPKLDDPRPAPLARPQPVVHHTPVDTAPARTRTLSPKRTGSATDLTQVDAQNVEPAAVSGVVAEAQPVAADPPRHESTAACGSASAAAPSPVTTLPPAVLQPEIVAEAQQSQPEQEPPQPLQDNEQQQQQQQQQMLAPTPATADDEKSAYSAPSAGYRQSDPPVHPAAATAASTPTPAATAAEEEEVPRGTHTLAAAEDAPVTTDEPANEEKPDPEPEPTPEELQAARWAKPLAETAVRDRVVRFYEKYNADRLGQVDEIVNRYGNDPPGLFGALRNKYGPEPGPVVMTRTRPKSNAAKPDSPPPPAAAVAPSKAPPASSAASAPATAACPKVVKMSAAQRPAAAASTSAASSASTTSASPTAAVSSPTPSQPRTVASAGASTTPPPPPAAAPAAASTGRRLSAKERLAQFKISDSDANSSDETDDE